MAACLILGIQRLGNAIAQAADPKTEYTAADLMRVIKQVVRIDVDGLHGEEDEVAVPLHLGLPIVRKVRLLAATRSLLPPAHKVNRALHVVGNGGGMHLPARHCPKIHPPSLLRVHQ